MYRREQLAVVCIFTAVAFQVKAELTQNQPWSETLRTTTVLLSSGALLKQAELLADKLIATGDIAGDPVVLASPVFALAAGN